METGLVTSQNRTAEDPADQASPWARIIYDGLIEADVKHITYVPDAGHGRLINLLDGTPTIKMTVLTTEEEGIAIGAGGMAPGPTVGVADAVQRRRQLCINMLLLLESCRLPFLTIVTMRGEGAEFNPWQIPMGRAVPQAFEATRVRTIRVERLDELADATSAGATQLFKTTRPFPSFCRGGCSDERNG
jgi:sulfopyruvate decarboxylase TPP-binding subunit